MPRLSLRLKLLGAVLVALVPVLALFTYDFFSDQAQRTDTVLDSQLQTAQTVAVLVDATFGSLTDVAWTFAKDPVILSFDADRIDAYLREFAPLYPEYSSIAVFDSNGRNAGSMRGLPVPRPQVADRDYFQQVMATNAPAISNLLVSRATERPVVNAAVPIRGDDGRPFGVMIVSLAIELFPEILRPVHTLPEQNIFIIDRTGRLAYFTGRPELTWEERDVSTNPVVQVTLREGQFRGVTEQGILLPGSRIIAATRAEESGWIAGVSVPVDVALAPVNNALRVKFAGYLAILLLGLFGAWWMADQILGPVRRLRDQALAIGRGQWHRRVNIKTGDELEIVGDAFNAMADEVQRAMQLREEFITVASHELRTPLTTIRGYAQLLLRKEQDEADRKALEAIVRSTERVDDLVRDMLEISKIRTQGVHLTRKRFDLVELVKSLADRMQLLAPRHRLIVKAQGPLEVNADPDRVEMVLTNLIDNAIRYSPEGGDVEIQVEARPHEAVVTVTDHGLGIPAEKQEEVFGPFFQMYPAIAGFGGMGLGLYISKQIVEAHGGKLWFESKEGKGSSFHFSLPLEDEAGA